MKLKLLSLFTFIVYLTSYSQIRFQTEVITDFSNFGTSVSGSHAADLDGDGDLDLLTYYYEGNFVWYENRPDEGRLVAPKIIHHSLNGSNSNVFAVDIDNDGDMDAVASSGYDVFWYENLDGLGDFGTQHVITTEVESVYNLDYYDLDGDGDMDILSNSAIDNKVAWYENVNGLGDFGPQQIISDGVGLVFAMSVEDMDGDGDGDVILTFDNLVWIENSDGNGTFTTEHIITTTRHNNFFPVDLDSDGDMDIVVPDGYYDDLIWYKNTNGMGDFGPKIIIDSSISGDVDVVFSDDIDGDGDVDILIDGIGLFYYVNDGNENFSGGLDIFSTTNGGGVMSHIYATDIDNDGDLDVLSDAFLLGGQGLAYSEYDETTNSFKPETFLNEFIHTPKGAFPADVDGDGDLDILMVSIGDNELSWFEDTDGNQNFGLQHIISDSVYHANSVVAADIDNDGDMDVFVPSETDDKIVWFQNQGDGTFGTEIAITTLTDQPSMIAIEDVDSDGDLDLLSSSFRDDKIAWYENMDGLGNFGVQQVIATDSDGPISIYAVDLDDDGDNDVAVSSTNSDEIVWYRNTDGAGSFGSKQVITFGVSNPQTLDFGDIDNDGDLDILSSASNNNYLAWYENEDGNGDFGYAIQIRYGSFGIVRLEDVDNDADLDAVVSVGDDILWYENEDGIGAFSTSSQHIMDIRYDKYYFTEDMDFDGDIDIVSTKSANHQLAYTKNLGILGNEINGTVQVDINGDGCNDLDAFTPNIMVVANNGSTSFGTFTRNDGSYQIPVNSGNFSTTIEGGLPAYLTSNPVAYVFNYTGIGNVQNADFCLEPNQAINDLNVSIFPLLQARPGFDVAYRIVYKNVGTEQLTGTIDFHYDSAMLNFLNSSETILNQTSNTLSFSYSDLNSYESRTIDVHFNVFPPPTVDIDDLIVLEATINPISGDFTTEDNSFVFNQIVVGSYDPNDITCLEGDEVYIDDADNYLHYMIRFQNIGSASAINVKVENTLNSTLDWNTLELVNTSHANRVIIKNGNELSFIFSGINLPNSTTDEPNSHGFIAYKIKPLDNVVVGDVVNNTADIFFDFNPPITTNTASTVFVETLSVVDIDSNQFTIYPNPTISLLNIKSNALIDEMAIMDINGRTLNQFLFDNPSSNIQINLEALRSGIYFLKIKSNEGYTNRKIIKR